MARNPTGKLFSYGDDGYDDIWAKWIENGSPNQFDRMGSFGGAIYHCYDLSATYPDFYQAVSRGPTLFDENSAAEKPYQRGMWLVNRDFMRLKASWTRDGRPKITRPEIPNDL